MLPFLKRRLEIFLMLSVIAHVGVLTGLVKAIPPSSPPHPGDSVVDIYLPRLAPSNRRSVAARTSSPPTILAATTRDHRAASEPLPKPNPVAEQHSGSNRVAAPQENPASPPHNQILGALKTRLSEYLTYPPLARLRGWEGLVLLDMHLEPDGRINKIQVARSSGYAVLDRSALNSLIQLGQLVEAKIWLAGSSIDVQLPVQFRLVDP